MKIKYPILFFMFLLSLPRSCPERTDSAESLQKIRVGFPSLALTYMPFYVAQEKGFLKKAGLEAEYIQMNTGIQPQAIICGNINFSLALDWYLCRSRRAYRSSSC